MTLALVLLCAKEVRRGPGSAYAFCTGCGYVAIEVEEKSAHEAHYWLERAVDADERKILGGIICNACLPRPNLICNDCGKIGGDAGAGYVWRTRTPTRHDLHRLPRRRCPDCVDAVLIKLLKRRLISAP